MIRPQIEAHCQRLKNDRVERQRFRARSHRLALAQALYEDYRRTILPSEWLYLPAPAQSTALLWCAEILELDPAVEVDRSDFDGPSANLTGNIEQWVAEKRDRFVAMLPEDYRRVLPRADSMTPTTFTSPNVDAIRQGLDRGALRSFLGPLELAVAVFEGEAASKPIMIARDLCNAWRDERTVDFMRPTFSANGSAAALQMVTLAGMDPKETLATDMDGKNCRFVCLNCYDAKGCSWTDVKAYTWRAAVSKLMSMYFFIITYYLVYTSLTNFACSRSSTKSRPQRQHTQALDGGCFNLMKL